RSPMTTARCGRSSRKPARTAPHWSPSASSSPTCASRRRSAMTSVRTPSTPTAQMSSRSASSPKSPSARTSRSRSVRTASSAMTERPARAATPPSERGYARLMSSWTSAAIALLEADANRSTDTHLHVFPLPAQWGIDLYLKDESVHPTGSLKHRLARSLVLYGLVNGRIHENTPLVEASSGSTAVSEAYFARMLGLDFITVVPRSTSPEKVELIEFYGGRCHFVDSGPEMYSEAERLASECGGHYLDQFTHAERATDWRGNNNIAESVFSQLERERHPIPEWIVVGAGTGGTSATFGRYVRYRQHPSRVAVVD